MKLLLCAFFVIATSGATHAAPQPRTPQPLLLPIRRKPSAAATGSPPIFTPICARSPAIFSFLRKASHGVRHDLCGRVG